MRLTEASLLAGEVLRLLTEISIQADVEREICCWLDTETHPIIPTAFLTCSSHIIDNPVIFANIIEKTISTQFAHEGKYSCEKRIYLLGEAVLNK